MVVTDCLGLLSEGGDHGSDVLCLEKTVREAGCERTT